MLRTKEPTPVLSMAGNRVRYVLKSLLRKFVRSNLNTALRETIIISSSIRSLAIRVIDFVALFLQLFHPTRRKETG